MDEQMAVYNGTLNYISWIYGIQSCNKGSSMVTDIVSRYWVGIPSCKDRLWHSKCNILDKESSLSFKDKAYSCLISVCERHGWRKEGVVDEVRHFEECCKFINKICETWEVLLV